MDVVFLDANVLFSAAYHEGSGLLRLWDLTDVQLMASDYTVEEARRNLEDPLALDRLEVLLGAVRIAGTPEREDPLAAARLPAKDRPVLTAAIAGSATVLVTGDVTHFAELFGTVVGGVRILRPAVYLRERRERGIGR